MKKKNKYDTSVVLLYLIGKEDLLPATFRKQIPYSTICSWRKTDFSSFKGHEFREIFIDHSDYIALKNKYEDLQRLMRAITRSWLCMRELMIEQVKDAGKTSPFQKNLVQAIAYLKKEIGLKKALKLFGISHTLYMVWADTVRRNCGSSHISLCVKKYPHQLHRTEVDKIRQMLLNSKWEHWPVVSIAALGLRSEKVVASMFSWYKYARMLDAGHEAVSRKRPTVGLQGRKTK
jgi:hypothetical protein